MKKLKFFLIGLIFSLPFWLGVNVGQAKLEAFILNQFFIPEKELAINPSLAPSFAPIPEELRLLYFEIKAKSFLTVKISSFAGDFSPPGEKIGKDGIQKTVFGKNSRMSLPIASLTKLMTAIVSVDYFPSSQKIEITPEMISQEGATGNLRAGEKVEVKELLEMVLVESSNDAADALAESAGRENFINLMNLKAKSLGLEETQFSTPTGLEAENNFSTSRDLTKLMAAILKNDAYSSILEISRQPSLMVYGENGKIHHRAINTNELLTSFEEFNKDFEIVGGKTGYTEEAGGCVILVLRDKAGDYFINVVLGTESSESRFLEMKKIIRLLLKQEI